MKPLYFFAALFLFVCGTSVYTLDVISFRNGSTVEAKVLEVTPSEIIYERTNGQVVTVSIDSVLNIKYENGSVETYNATPSSNPPQERIQASPPQRNTTPQENQQREQITPRTNQPQGQAQASPPQRETVTPQTSQPPERVQPSPSQGGSPTPQTTLLPASLQSILNNLPAVPIAGNNLKFLFRGQEWVASVNGENFSKGTTEFKETAEGGTLTLRQTHIWPGAVGRTAGRIVSRIPGGGAASNALNKAGNVAGAAGPIPTSGTIVIEYRANPPSLKLISAKSDKSSQGGGSSGGVAAGSGKSSGGRSAGTRGSSGRGSSGSGGSSGRGRSSRNDEKGSNVMDNWLSGNIYVFPTIGLGVNYERMLNSHFSLGANVYGGVIPFENGPSNPFWGFIGAEAFARWYPWGKTFFMGYGIGFYNAWYEWFEKSYFYDSFGFYRVIGQKYGSMAGFANTAEMGWKLDPGNPGDFFMLIGVKTTYLYRKNPKTGTSPSIIGGSISIGLGKAW